MKLPENIFRTNKHQNLLDSQSDIFPQLQYELVQILFKLYKHAL